MGINMINIINISPVLSTLIQKCLKQGKHTRMRSCSTSIPNSLSLSLSLSFSHSTSCSYSRCLHRHLGRLSLSPSLSLSFSLSLSLSLSYSFLHSFPPHGWLMLQMLPLPMPDSYSRCCHSPCLTHAPDAATDTLLGSRQRSSHHSHTFPQSPLTTTSPTPDNPPSPPPPKKTKKKNQTKQKKPARMLVVIS